MKINVCVCRVSDVEKLCEDYEELMMIMVMFVM